MWTPIKLPYTNLPGLSEALIRDHYQLYLNYLTRWDTVQQRLEDAVDEYQRVLLAQEAGMLKNAGRLHELYFENLIPDGSGDPQAVLGLRADEVLTRMHDLALASTGWVILGADPRQEDPELIVMPNHGTGFTVDSLPLLVLDCYEHAYMPEYGLDKDAYLEAFFANVCWTTVGERSQAVTAGGGA